MDAGVDGTRGKLLLATLAITLGVAVGSALIPMINVEIFLIAVATREAHLPWQWLALGAVVAAGQMVGKLPYYYAGRGSLRLPEFLRPKPKQVKPMTPRRLRWKNRTKRWRGWVDGITEKCRRHPRWMIGTYGISAVTGVPPYMAIVVLAGLARMSLVSFLVTGLIGRCIRFTVLAASPDLVTHLIF